MDSIRDELNYFHRKNDSFTRGHHFISTYEDDKEEVDEMRQNVRNAMKEARRKMANLRRDADEKDKLLSEEKILRHQLERELSEKSEELLREKSKSLMKDGGGKASREGHYPSPLHFSHDYSRSSLLHNDDLETSKSLNAQLTERLANAEIEIQATRMTRDGLLMQAESRIAAQGAALVDKIYQAQKERDAAVNARLRQAKEEKEDLLSRMHRLEKEQAGFDSGVDSVNDEEDTEQSIKELLDRLSALESPRSIDKQGTIMAGKLTSVQKTHQRAMAEEMKIVLEERDQAISKVKVLEEEVTKLQKELKMLKNQFKLAEKHRVKTTQAQLLSSQHERDASLRKTKRLEEELETIRVYYRSLSQEQNLRDQFNSTMDGFEDRLRMREGELVLAQRSYDDLVSKLRSVSGERSKISEQFQQMNKNYQQEKERADKLERLVGVLRKRINAGASASLETIN